MQTDYYDYYYFYAHIHIHLFRFVFTEDSRANLASAYGGEIIIQVSNNVLHQINSHIFGTLASEFLNYDVTYEDIHYSKNSITEKEKLYETLEELMYV